MKKERANYYLYRIYQLIKSDKISIVFKKMRTKRGETDTLEIIWLDHRDDIIPTFIHECLHVLYNHWSEKKVVQYEKEISNKLSPQQIKNLLLRLACSANKIHFNKI